MKRKSTGREKVRTGNVPETRRLTLRERLARMTPEELAAALRATREGRERDAAFLARIDLDYEEALEVLHESWDALIAAQEDKDSNR